MAYSIEAALASQKFNTVMVSTDSAQYASIAAQYGAEVPFLRSDRNSSDTASSWDMVEEVLRNYEKYGRAFDTFCLLQPTSPLRNENDIKQAYELYEDRAKFAVISVCKTEHSPLWNGILGSRGSLEGFIPVESMRSRQENGEYYRLNGAIYIVDVEKFYNNRYFYRKGSFAFIMDPLHSIDIDTELDFRFAEFLMSESNL